MAKRPNSRSSILPALCHRLLILLSIFALTGSLVTRTFHSELSFGITAQSNSPHAVRQHLDRDAIRWVAPVPNFSPLRASTFHSSMVTAVSPLPSLIADENLYNRPPPSC